MFVVLANGIDVGLIQRYRLADYPDWTQTVAGSGLNFPTGAGIDYAIGEPTAIGSGLGTAMIREFTVATFEAYPDVDTIVVTPQAANIASCRVLEKNSYDRVWVGTLDSDDPSDAGMAAMYVRRRSAV